MKVKANEWAPGYERCQVGCTVAKCLYRQLKIAACRLDQPVGVMMDIALDRFLDEIEANDGRIPPHVPWWVGEQGDEFADDDEYDEQGE